MNELALRVILFSAILVVSYLTWQTGKALAGLLRVTWGLRSVPAAPGSHWLVGHIPKLLKSVPWDLMASWLADSPPLLKVNILNSRMVLVGR